MDAEQFIDLTPVRPARRPTLAEEVADQSQPPPHRPIFAQPAQQHHQQHQRRDDLSYLWGTLISVEVFREDFRRYLETFDGPPQDGAPRRSLATSAPSTALTTTTSLIHASGSHLASSRDGSNSSAYYIMELIKMHAQGRRVLELDMAWMEDAAPQLYLNIIQHPTECLQLISTVADLVYREVVQQRYRITVGDDVTISVAPRRMTSMLSLKELSPCHIERLISLKGMVIRVSKVIPEIRVACFRCWNCSYVERSVSGDKGRLFEPTRCAHCGGSYSFKLQHSLSLYEDKQLIKIQESPEHVSDGETPISISIVVYGDLVDAVVPGDRVVVTGIYRSVPIRLNANTRMIKSIFSTHVDAVHVELLHASRAVEKKRSGQSSLLRPTLAPSVASAGVVGGVDATSTDDGTSRVAGGGARGADTARLDMLHRLARRPDIHDVLLRSLAPAIWGHEDVKRGILAQLFGGTPKSFVFSNHGGGGGAEDSSNNNTASSSSSAGTATAPNTSTASFRSELNVILCGDPGVAKSQLLTLVHEIAPRGVYTSGKGSSSVGLTAFVVQDHETGELVLEPGALVLSDQGLCCIDEFDKMNDATRSVLHEVMEQQTLSIAKAGIIAQLNARTSILAAANPKESQWNLHRNVVENLQIEPTLLSRFDLIFLLLDRHDAEEDKRLASHVLDMYMTADDRKGGSGAAAPTAEADSGEDGDDDDDNVDGRRQRRGGGGGQAQRRNTAREEETGPAVVLEHDGEVFLRGTRAEPFMPPSILSEYISIARETVRPKLTEAAHKQLATSYVELRRARGNNRTVSATLRQLESMIRLSEARAKMRFASEVLVEDVMEAKRLISAALKESATDPTTGLISLDMFHAPDPTKNTVEGNMRRLEDIILRNYTSRGRTSATVTALRTTFNEHMVGQLRPLSPAQFVEVLALMSGGEVVRSFSSTTVVFAEGAGEAVRM